MPEKSVNIFLTGATGYIGGTVLHRLLTEPPFDVIPDVHVTVRTLESRLKLLDRYPRLDVTVASYADVAQLAPLISQADIIIHCGGSADNSHSLRLIHTYSQPHSFLIHTGGSAVLCYPDEDNRRGSHIFNDVTHQQLISSEIPLSHIHRHIDKLFFTLFGQRKAIILCPALVYGHGSGVGNTHSIQIPAIVKTLLLAERPVEFPSRETIWSSVHVDDLADLYMLILRVYCKDSTQLQYGGNGYYFAADSELRLSEVADDIVKRLQMKSQEREKASKESTTVITEKELNSEDFAATRLGASVKAEEINTSNSNAKESETVEMMPETLNDSTKETKPFHLLASLKSNRLSLPPSIHINDLIANESPESTTAAIYKRARFVMQNNSRVRAFRAFRLGWVPVRGDAHEFLDEEINYWQQELGISGSKEIGGEI